MTGDHGNAVTGLVGLADGEGDDGAAVSGGVVLATRLEFASPGISAR
jgi:hypothetical protein